MVLSERSTSSSSPRTSTRSSRAPAAASSRTPRSHTARSASAPSCSTHVGHDRTEYQPASVAASSTRSCSGKARRGSGPQASCQVLPHPSRPPPPSWRATRRHWTRRSPPPLARTAARGRASSRSRQRSCGSACAGSPDHNGGFPPCHERRCWLPQSCFSGRRVWSYASATGRTSMPCTMARFPAAAVARVAARIRHRSTRSYEWPCLRGAATRASSAATFWMAA
mmetsp:Transcript_121340/g.387846  ORF Transcript_121340/g.387846 Transcript_121340/m.387846 type:complete len:225 (-) Transcript_121340:108-782(-)